jgi:hypothetical protein
MPSKERQISVRVSRQTDDWLERRAGGRSNKADFVRRLIENEMARKRDEELLQMFNEAAASLTDADRIEREALLGAFASNESIPRSKEKLADE